ncbi:MAG: hypothetical protein AAFV33_14445, partial [Chloroflexota bacterium]
MAFGACSLLTVTAIFATLFIFRDQLVNAGFEVAGFEAEGRTDDIFTDVQSNPVPQVVQQEQAPAQFSVSAGTYGQETIPNNAGASLIVGTDETGQDIATVTSTEGDFVELCRAWSYVCTSQGITESGYTVRNASIDLKPGGGIVYAEVQPEGSALRQRVGLVMQVEGTRLVVRGVDVNGFLYSSPPAELATLVNEAERVANDVIRQVAVTAQGEQYDLESISINDGSLTVILR